MNAARAKGIADFLWWAVHDGQQFNEGLQYAKLPPSVVELNERTLRSLRHQGQALVS
jgi:phosphate transport system substrate-binding protein